MNKSLNHLKHVFILLAPGFEEGSAIYCVDKLRDFGLPVSLVSLSTDLVNSKHGVSIKPDRSIDDINSIDNDCHLVIIPGGTSSTASLLTDPRTHRLLKKHKGLVAAMETAVPLLKQFKIPDTFANRFIQKCPQQNLRDFTDQLIHAVAA